MHVASFPFRVFAHRDSKIPLHWMYEDAKTRYVCPSRRYYYLVAIIPPPKLSISRGAGHEDGGQEWGGGADLPQPAGQPPGQGDSQLLVP